MNKLNLIIPSKSNYIKIVRQCLKDYMKIVGYNNEEDIFMMELALNEVIANIIEHTYKYKDDQIVDILFNYVNEELTIEFRDYGEKVDPTKVKSRELDDYRDGGLGVYIIQHVFGGMQWLDCDVGNRLILKRKLV